MIESLRPEIAALEAELQNLERSQGSKKSKEAIRIKIENLKAKGERSKAGEAHHN